MLKKSWFDIGPLQDKRWPEGIALEGRYSASLSTQKPEAPIYENLPVPIKHRRVDPNGWNELHTQTLLPGGFVNSLTFRAP
jgi:hypothetical protein